MPILNYEKFPMLWTHSLPEDSPPPEEPKSHIQWKISAHRKFPWLAELNSREGDYFYIEIMHRDAFFVYPLDTLVPADILDKIKSGQVTLVIANTGHGYHEIVGGIYKHIIIKYDINPKHVILRSESYDMKDELDIVAYNYNLPKLNLEWILEFEYEQSNKVRQSDWYKVNTLQHKHYDKKFLSFNGICRPHRSALVFLLHCQDLMKYGYVSYNVKPGNNDDSPHMYHWISGNLRHNEKFLNLMTSNKDLLMNIGRIVLDPEHEANKNVVEVYPSHLEYYENSYVSVVTETSFPADKIHPFWPYNTDIGRILSEKIFKPISMKHPFIVVSNPRTLELLRSLGYKTFDPLIDETYDKVQDPAVRLMMITNEIKKLCELEGEALINFLTKAKEICDYNFEVLKNKRQFEYKHS